MTRAVEEQGGAGDHDCNALLDLNGNFLLLTGQACQKCGCPAIGQSWIAMWDADDRPAARHAVESAGNGEIGVMTGRMACDSGDSVWWNVTITPLRGVDGRVSQLLAFARDDNSRRRASLHAACLASIRREIAPLTHHSEALQAVAARLGMHLLADSCAFPEVDEAAGIIHIRQEWKQENVPSIIGDCPIQHFLTDAFRATSRAGETVVVDDAESDPLLSAETSHWPDFRSILSVPMLLDGVWSLSLNLHNSSPRAWRQDEIHLVEEVAALTLAHLDRLRYDVIQARLAAIVESSGDAVVSKDLHGIINSWNQGATAIFGYSADEVIGKPITLLLPDDRKSEEDEVLATVTRGESIRNHETVRQTKDGRLIDIALTVSPIINSRGEIVGASKIARDITVRKRAEQELIESEERFRTMANAITHLAWTAEPDGYISWYNQSWLDYTGTTLEEMEGWGWQAVNDPAELPRVLKTWQESIKSGQTFELTFPLRGADGRFRQFLSRAIPLKNADGKIVRWFGTNTDVDELTRTEQALRESHMRASLAIQATGVGIWEWHLPSNRVHWDAEMFRIYGMNPTTDDWITYSDWRDTVLPEDLEWQESAMRDILDGRSHGKRIFRIHRPGQQEIRYIETVEAVRHNDAGEAEWLVGTNLDVTTRKQIEQTLIERTAQLVQADRSKDEFLAMLAHELRNPLTPMRNATAILHSPTATGDQRETAQTLISRQIGNLSRMIDDLLDVSRITAGKITLHRQALSLREILSQAADAILPDCDAHRQKLEVSLPASGIFVDADATRLEQIFGNLLGNACKYSGHGSHISLAAETISPAEVTIRISDDGIGIDPGLLPRIFDLFVQSSRTLDRTHGGLGIGLTVVQRLVILHGGTITVHSEGPGCGTSFLVRLPTIPAPAATPVLANHSPEAGRPLRILVVDDNIDAAETMATLQGLRGHQPRIAHNGPDALALAADFLPQAILLDIGLPGMDGYEIASRLRANPATQDAFLVALTGYGSENDRNRAKAAGFDEHLTKPADLELLREWLDNLP